MAFVELFLGVGAVGEHLFDPCHILLDLSFVHLELLFVL